MQTPQSKNAPSKTSCHNCATKSCHWHKCETSTNSSQQDFSASHVYNLWPIPWHAQILHPKVLRLNASFSCLNSCSFETKLLWAITSTVLSKKTASEQAYCIRYLNKYSFLQSQPTYSTIASTIIITHVPSKCIHGRTGVSNTEPLTNCSSPCATSYTQASTRHEHVDYLTLLSKLFLRSSLHVTNILKNGHILTI